MCVNEPGQQKQPQEHLHLQCLLISRLFLYCNVCLIFVEEEKLHGKNAIHCTQYILKGAFVGLVFSHRSASGSPVQYLLWEPSVHRHLGQLKLLLCLLGKVRKRKQTLQERAENIPLQTYPINTLDRNTREGLPWACAGQVLSQGVAALRDSLQITQWRSSVDQDKLWMAEVWFSHLHGNHPLSAPFSHTDVCGPCPSLWSVPAWCHLCFGLRLLGATLST